MKRALPACLSFMLLKVYRLGDDPKVSTAAQRTWLPAHDPGVKAMLNVRERLQKNIYVVPISSPVCVRMMRLCSFSLPIHCAHF